MVRSTVYTGPGGAVNRVIRKSVAVPEPEVPLVVTGAGAGLSVVEHQAVRARLRGVLEPMGPRVKSVVVRLSDVGRVFAGEKRCRIELYLGSEGLVLSEATAVDEQSALELAANRLSTAIARRLRRRGAEARKLRRPGAVAPGAGAA